MNTLKNIGFTIALLFAVSCVLGQETKPKSKRIISLNLYKSIVYNVGSTSSSNTISLGNFTPSVTWGTENEDFNEIEITNFSFFNRSSSFILGLGSEYTYNWKLLDMESAKTGFYIGTGIGFDAFKSSYSPYTSTSFAGSQIKLEVNLSISPLFRWNLTDKYYLNFSTPYHLYSYSYNYINSEDPSLPLEQRKQTINSSKIFPNNFTVKVGIGINF